MVEASLENWIVKGKGLKDTIYVCIVLLVVVVVFPIITKELVIVIYVQRATHYYKYSS